MSIYTYCQLEKLFIDALTPDAPTSHASWLVQKLTGRSSTDLILNPKIELSDDQQKLMQKWCIELREHKPAQYILGEMPFVDVDIIVRAPILIPRYETEDWVADLIDMVKDSGVTAPRILDLCTGSGCIAVAIAHALPEATVIAVDLNREACELARENVQKNSCNNVTVLESDLFTALADEKPFDIVVTNPPYIPRAAYEALDPSVKEWEDERALVAGDDGLNLIKKIITELSAHVSKKYSQLPVLVMEIDHTHAAEVVDLLSASGFTGVVKKDLFGEDRVIIAH